MKTTTRLLLIVASTCIFLYLNISAIAKADSSIQTQNQKSFEKAQSLRYQYPDSSVILLHKCYDNFINEGDTLQAIDVLTKLANVYGHQANYKKSYDKLWKALFLADEAQLATAKASVYINIGRYYSFYKRARKTFEYFDLSLNINKNLVADGTLKKSHLVQSYYPICATYRELNQPQKAQIYLDSCYLYYSPKNPIVNEAYLKFEQASIFNENQQYQQALDTFHQILPWIRNNDSAYQVLVYSYMGDSYKGLKNFSESENYYKKALAISKKYNSHVDFTPLVHEKLSDLYFSQGDQLNAYKSQKRAKELDQIFFDSRSANNRPLLEIQDAFRKEKEKQKKLFQEQRLIQLENEEKVLFLERTILMGSLFFLLLVGGIYFKYVQSKHRAEKQLIKNKQELEIQKAHEIVELKNKELAASALKLIEKDEFLSTLKQKLSKGEKDIDVHEVRRIVQSVSVSSNQNWKEFEARFVSINKRFYIKLKEQFPKLTQGDLKLCALIKLNFSSKEMASLLGISVESVHTTRYRLRKKLNLSRDINLTEFISQHS